MQSELTEEDMIALQSVGEGAKQSAFEPSASGADGIEMPLALAAAPGGFEYSNPLLMDLPVVMKVVLGSAKMPLASVAGLAKGSVVRLDKKVGDPVEIFVNGRLIAKGEVVVLDHEANRFGIVLTEIVGAVGAGRQGR